MQSPILLEIKQQKEYQEREAPSSLPLLGVILDEKFPEGPERPFCNESTFKNIMRSVHHANVKVFFILFEDFPRLHDILQKIDGLFISGGRDIHPKFYGQENTHAKVFKEVNLRVMFTETILNEAPKKLPILATCWGYEYMNVYFGGSLIQDIGDSDKKHSQNLNKFKIAPKSWLHKLFGDEVEGMCNHHQNLGMVSDAFRVVARCQDGHVHGIELIDEERFMVGILWHFEIDYKTQGQENSKIFVGFRNNMCEYRRGKSVSE